MSDNHSQLHTLIMKATGPTEVQRFLDALPDRERPAAVCSLNPRAQRKLWGLSDGFRPVSLDDMVPRSHPPLEPVVHHGRNSLLAFTRFQKRFYRFGERHDALGGANFQSIAKITGPGYYVAYDDIARGEVLVNYTELPAERPQGWPEIVPNDRGLSQFIYGHTVDTLRRVSEHVTIGHAARKGKEIPAWFVLCREALP